MNFLSHLRSMRISFLSALKIVALIIAIILPSVLHAGQNIINSLPYTVTPSDNYDTLRLASSHLTSAGRALTFSDNVHDVYLDFGTDTLTWGTGGVPNTYGIWVPANNLYNITIDGGYFVHDPPQGARSPSVLLMNKAIRFGGQTHDITLKNAYFSIYGRNSQIIYTEGGEYNMEIANCVFDDHKESFTARDQWADAAMIAIWNQNPISAIGFQYHYKIHDCTTLNSHWANLYLHGDGFVADIYNNYFIVDARNDFDTTGGGPIYGSAGQCYAVSIRGGDIGARIKFHDNIIRSGTNYAGGRGIFIAAINGASLDPDSSINIYNNDIQVHQGFDGEYTTLNGIIVRQGWKNIILRGNTIICVGDTSQGLGSSYDRGPISGIRLTTGIGGESGLRIIGNTVKTYLTGNWTPNYSMGEDGMFAACIMFDEYAMNTPGVAVDSNWFESNDICLKWGFGNGQGGNITARDNYFSSHNNEINYTFYLGLGWNSTRNAYNNLIIDPIVQGIASDTSIYISDQETDSLSIGLEAALNTIVYGNNNLPVPGATVWVKNAYGDTVGQGITNGNGIFQKDVSYWWECNSTFGMGDSTAFNEFTIKVRKGTDSTSISYHVSPQTRFPLLTLGNTPGEGGQDDIIPPGAISDLVAAPGDQHGFLDLNWSAPGDDGNVGVASYYMIKYSTEPINEFNFPSANSVADPPTPSSAGSFESFTITGLTAGQEYYIAVKAYDEVGNEAPISNPAASFAAGIMTPTPAETYVDPGGLWARLSVYSIHAYMPVSYEFVLDTVITFPNPRVDYGVIADTISSVTFAELSSEVTYFWKCRAIAPNNADSSDWSVLITFNVITGVSDVLFQADCIYPAMNQVIDTANPIFQVRYVDGIPHIYFRVDDDQQFAAPVESGPIPSTSGQPTTWQIPSRIIAGIKYYWEISADNQVWTAPINFSALLDVHPYPNPFKASMGHTNVVFTNLLQNSDITIATASGDIVFEIDGVGPGEWSWNVQNKNGNDVSSGIYLFHVGFPTGSASGKLMIIR